MAGGRKCSISLFSAIASYLAIFSAHGHSGKGGNISDTLENSNRIATSPSWTARQACHWLDFCEVTQLDKGLARIGSSHGSGESSQKHAERPADPQPDQQSYWLSGPDSSSNWSDEERKSRKIPSYVYEYTPYVHLFSSEEYWPCDIADHLVHTTPFLNYTPISNLTEDRTLDNLGELNQYGRFTFLHSNDNVEERPTWLGGNKNIPGSPGASDPSNSREHRVPPGSLISHVLPHADQEDWYSAGIGNVRAQGGIRPKPTSEDIAASLGRRVKAQLDRVRSEHKTHSTGSGGYSSAPAVLVVVDKGHGVVDAFWFYFYSYNLGNQVLNVRFGNHVGDWEHSVVRFHHGVPKAMFLSEHNFGEAYSYEAMEKIGKRPVIYSAVGTHAMYATPGLHPYVLPWGLLHDETDRGPLWDPLLNNHGFVYNYTSGVLRSSAQTPKAPVSWFDYKGHWGDMIYPMSDSRQYRFAGQYHYVTGPLGPRFKNLGRTTICQGNQECVIKDSLGLWNEVKEWPGSSDEEDEAPDSE